MLPRVKKVEYIDGYRLKIQFTNGKTKIVDLEGRLKNAKNLFLDLKDLEYFKKVECDGYSICWPNGIDYCPDLLYMIGQDVKLPTQRRKKPSKASSARKTTRANASKSSRSKA
jgi:hypothetical protein